MSGRKKATVPPVSKEGNGQQPPPAAPAAGNEKERLDQRLKKKIQAFRARKKEANNLDNNDSQKRNSFSSRKKKTITTAESKGENRTIEKEKTDSKKTREETTVTTDDAIPAGTPAWKTKRVDELVKGDIIFGKRMSCRIADCICIEEHGRVFKAFSTKQIEGSQPPKKDKEDMFPLAVKTDIASGSMKKWFNTEKDVLLAISLLRPGSIAEHFPQIFDSGELYFFRYIMMSLHGPNLERLRRDILKTDFTIGTALRVAYQILTAVVDLHLIGYIHRDLKPQNFVIGMDTGSEWFLRSTNLRTVYMVGFGTCVKKKVALEKTERRFVNLTFGSRKSHNLTHVLDKNDDIESWLFLAVELFKRGSLPWRQKKSNSEILIMKQKFFEEIGFAGMYDFAPEQFKTIIQKSFVDISEGKSINTHYIREAFRDISKKHHVTDGAPYDWEMTNNRRQTNEAAEPGAVDGGAKKWMIPKGMQPKPLPTTAAANAGTTTPTIEEENDENDKIQESTNLDETPSVMLRRVVFEKNNENNGVEDVHSCPSLDPTISQTSMKNAVDNDVKLRSKIPKAIPPDDPLLKLTLNKSKKSTKAAATPLPPPPQLGQQQQPAPFAASPVAKKPPTNRMKNGTAANNNNNASSNNNLPMRIKKDRSEDRDTTRSTTTEDK